jgi:hypothetical protein
MWDSHTTGILSQVTGTSSSTRELWKAWLDGFYFALIGAFEYDSSYHGEQAPGINYIYHVPFGVTVGWGFCLPANLLLNVELFGVGFGYNGGVWADGTQNSSFGFAGIPNGGIYLQRS